MEDCGRIIIMGGRHGSNTSPSHVLVYQLIFVRRGIGCVAATEFVPHRMKKAACRLDRFVLPLARPSQVRCLINTKYFVHLLTSIMYGTCTVHSAVSFLGPSGSMNALGLETRTFVIRCAISSRSTAQSAADPHCQLQSSDAPDERMPQLWLDKYSI